MLILSPMTTPPPSIGMSMSTPNSLRLISVLAEGVETAEQLELVRAAGCTHVQGHHLSRPLPPGELAALLTEARRRTGRPRLPLP